MINIIRKLIVVIVMQVMIDGKIMKLTAVWEEEGSLKYIDQSLLPSQLKIAEAKSSDDVAEAIINMRVRGAPSIGAFAALGLAIAIKNGEKMDKALSKIKNTRPTANDLFYALDIVANTYGDIDPLETARTYVNKVINESRKIGELGKSLIKKNMNILTHCNAGALATIDWGTALSPIRFAKMDGMNPFVYVDETRPLLQGARLTSWELREEGIDHKIIVDNAAGFLMYKKEIDLVIVGADRIARNGDVANKIGTYEKAIVAKENRIPFYVAAPLTTFDKNIKSGNGIPIEIRNEIEVVNYNGIRTAPENVHAYNPAFDITPARYITGYITPIGIFKPEQLFLYFGKIGYDR